MIGRTKRERRSKQDFYPARLLGGVMIGAVGFVAAGALPLAADVPPYPAQMAAAVTCFVATCWLSRALPMAAASLAPIALMPLLGVLTIDQAATAYAHPIIWMFFGGFVLALGVERWGLHRRMALGIITRVGVSPSRLILGFMCAGCGLSMWLNNTSTTLLLFPIGVALIESMEKAKAVHHQGAGNFAFALMVGIAYACSIGGMGTPISTAPNALYLTNWAPFEAAGGPAMTFVTWMAVAVPMTLLMLPATWWLLTRVLAPQPKGNPEAAEILAQEARSLPRMGPDERRMLGLFVLAGVLWTTRRDLVLGEWGTIPGWWHLLPVASAKHIGDGAVAVLVALLTFVTPSGRKPGQALMDWKTAKTLPWDILLLIGGGIAIARAFAVTGLAQGVGEALRPIAAQWPAWTLVPMACLLLTFLTEVTSNTATTALLLPVLAGMSTALGLDPRLVMLPAALSASCAFMLPIATPPNAIVFSSGRINMLRMAKTGLWINLLGAAIISTVMLVWGTRVLGIDMAQAPSWAQAQQTQTQTATGP